mmetsp:Transcript_29962/g.73752  ORF Transcript_29962/g.73752 Transcript_29962/m.73752 type:complete len:468 (-) Transcript_29962:44-1447(-)
MTCRRNASTESYLGRLFSGHQLIWSRISSSVPNTMASCFSLNPFTSMSKSPLMRERAFLSDEVSISSRSSASSTISLAGRWKVELPPSAELLCVAGMRRAIAIADLLTLLSSHAFFSSAVPTPSYLLSLRIWLWSACIRDWTSSQGTMWPFRGASPSSCSNRAYLSDCIFISFRSTLILLSKVLLLSSFISMAISSSASLSATSQASVSSSQKVFGGSLAFCSRMALSKLFLTSEADTLPSSRPSKLPIRFTGSVVTGMYEPFMSSPSSFSSSEKRPDSFICSSTGSQGVPPGCRFRPTSSRPWTKDSHCCFCFASSRSFSRFIMSILSRVALSSWTAEAKRVAASTTPKGADSSPPSSPPSCPDPPAAESDVVARPPRRPLELRQAHEGGIPAACGHRRRAGSRAWPTKHPPLPTAPIPRDPASPRATIRSTILSPHRPAGPRPLAAMGHLGGNLLHLLLAAAAPP